MCIKTEKLYLSIKTHLKLNYSLKAKNNSKNFVYTTKDYCLTPPSHTHKLKVKHWPHLVLKTIQQKYHKWFWSAFNEDKLPLTKKIKSEIVSRSDFLKRGSNGIRAHITKAYPGFFLGGNFRLFFLPLSLIWK